MRFRFFPPKKPYTCPADYTKGRPILEDLRYTEVPESSAKTTCCLKEDIAMKIKSNKDKTIDKIAESSVEMSVMLLL